MVTPASEALAAPADALTRHGKPIASVFDLLGTSENDLTSALGFGLDRSPALVRLILESLGQSDHADVVVRMETADDLGRTDLELDTGASLWVIEAKRGWQLPTEAQLHKYANRVEARGQGALVTLSDCSSAWAANALPSEVDGVPVVHLPWSEVKDSISSAVSKVGGRERLWLRELGEYLRRAVRVTDPASGWTYCVALNNERPGNGGPYTFREFVVEEDTYFHPFGWGKGWPTDAPNFLAFRWNGHVQQVRRVLTHTIEKNLQARWPDIPKTPNTTRPCVIYDLGPPIPMPRPLPSGTNYRAARVWVLLDQLLTCTTLKEALAASKKLAAVAR